MVLEVRIEDKVTAHAWNADRTLLAVCPNNNTVAIFRKPDAADGAWERVATLSEHDALVTDIAWAPKTNRILTTSQDRNAYVWNLEGSEWKPMLVILRITAAATSVQWSADEQKFAVGSGARTVPICYFEAENNFWVSKMLKGHRSTVQAVTWHPTTPIVATACTDFKCRLFSAYLKNVDGKNVTTPWGDCPKFGTCFFEVESLGWTRDVTFSPDGGSLAFCSHNSTVTFIDVSSGGSETLKLAELPLTSLMFLPDGSMVGVGHCFSPLLFTKGASGWVASGKVAAKVKEEKVRSNVAAARHMFQVQATTGQSEEGAAAGQLNSAHMNLVCGLQPFDAAFGGVQAEFTTSGLDGKVVFWTRDELTEAMAGVKL